MGQESTWVGGVIINRIHGLDSHIEGKEFDNPQADEPDGQKVLNGRNTSQEKYKRVVI